MEKINSIGEEEIPGMMTRTQYMSGMRKAILFIMIVMAISFSISGVSALNFSFDYPNEVFVGEEFEVSLDVNSQEDYDVKIYVHDDVRASSEIFDGTSWKSTQRYLISAWPSKNVFEVKAHSLGGTNICIKLRKTGETSAEGEQCEDIEVKENTSGNSAANNKNNNNAGSNNTNVNNVNTNNINEEEPEETQEKEITEIIRPLSANPSVENRNEKIVLNPPTTREEKSFMTVQEKTRLGVFISFIVMMFILITLLAWRKL